MSSTVSSAPPVTLSGAAHSAADHTVNPSAADHIGNPSAAASAAASAADPDEYIK